MCLVHIELQYIKVVLNKLMLNAIITTMIKKKLKDYITFIIDITVATYKIIIAFCQLQKAAMIMTTHSMTMAMIVDHSHNGHGHQPWPWPSTATTLRCGIIIGMMDKHVYTLKKH